jgi:hypothetical protein
MDAITASLPTLDDLRRHVLERLCARGRLDPEQAPLHQAVVTRSGRACGLFFRVDGPRQVRSHAVWAAPERRVLFYDSAGERFAETRLKKAPDVQELAA